MRLSLLFVLLPTLALAQTPARPQGARSAPAAPTQQSQATTPTPAAPAASSTTPAPAAVAVTTMTDEQKTIYALGLIVQRSLRSFDFDAAELELVKRAITDASNGRPALPLDEWGPKVQPLAQARGQRVTAKEKAASAAYLATAAAAAGAVRTETGIVFTDLTEGTGASPTPADTVKVHYRGTLRDGTEFDSSYARNEPIEFALGRVIPCWTQGLQRMKVGGKARLVCPSDLAYGDGGNQDIPGGAALVFEVELLAITSPAGN
jgi:FKBP-type peptidyl-prolyl cis-trans isomerase FkpA